ncbi:MAG: extracellular solute-binding protein [Myxococcota bacterium]
MKPLDVRTLVAILSLTLLAAAIGCSAQGTQEVVVYVSEDQVFSEPILEDFERETGIRVRAVFDTEEAKSTGVMNRLVAERNNPQADVYWANEPIRAESLRQQGMTSPYVSPAAAGIPTEYKNAEGHWTGFSARARVLLVHKNLPEKPSSVFDLADPRFRGRVAIANPLFGTTTAEIAALFALKGDPWGREFMGGLRANQVRVTGSNGESADAVASGEVGFSLVDSDDAVSRMRQGRPIEMVVPDQGEGEAGVFLVPNAVLILRGAPHLEAAKRLVDYLLAPETERKLAAADCAQLPLQAGVEPPRELPPVADLKLMIADYAKVAAKMKELESWLQTWSGM